MLCLENQVVSLELAKKLKSLNVKQESLFYWITHPYTGENQVIYYEDRNQLRDDFIDNRYKLVSAFTVAELGMMLPSRLWVDKKQYWIEYYFDDGIKKWNLYFITENREKVLHIVYEKTEADARAKMLIYLLENKLIAL